MTEIRYINVNGGGFNGRLTIEDGTTVERFFSQKMPGEVIEKFSFRVNNSIPVPGQILYDGDLVSIIPGKYDGGAMFGSEFLKNLQAASELGRLARQTPDLTADLRAINDLGAALKAAPELATNLAAVCEFVQAVKFLDRPAEPPASGPEALVREALDPAHPLHRAFERDDEEAASRHRSAEYLALHQFGSAAEIREKLLRANAQAGAAAVRITTRDIDTTPPAPGCVRLLTGYGLGDSRPVEPGETIGSFFARIKPGRSPEQYRIEINGSTVEPDQVLNEGDSVLVCDIDAVQGKLAARASCL